METKRIVRQIVAFLVYLAIHVLLVRYISIGTHAFCFVYLVFLLLLPIEVGIIPLLFIGLLSGFTVDLFGNTPGIHAAATVLLAYLRNFWLESITPQGGYEQGSNLLVQNQGFTWFLTYAFPLIFVHHLVLFLLEAGNLALFGTVLLNTVLSSVFTFSISVLIQYLFYSGGRR